MKKVFFALLIFSGTVYLILLAVVETDKKEFNKSFKEHQSDSIKINDTVYHFSTLNSEYFDLAELKKISNLAMIIPPPYLLALPVYILNTNDSVTVSDFEKLKSVYTILYTNKYSTLDSFLFDVLNRRIKVNINEPQTHYYYSQTFLLDSHISSLYKEKNIKGLITKYCIENKNSYALKKNSLTPNQINSISFYFFVNQFMRVDDDYEASIQFKKLTSLLENFTN